MRCLFPKELKAVKSIFNKIRSAIYFRASVSCSSSSCYIALQKEVKAVVSGLLKCDSAFNAKVQLLVRAG